MIKIIFFIITLQSLISCQVEYSNIDEISQQETLQQSNEELQNKIKSKIENQEIQSSNQDIYDVESEEDNETLFVNYEIGEEQVLDAQYTIIDDDDTVGANLLEIIRDDELLYSDTHDDKPENMVIDASQNLQDETPQAINYEQNQIKLCSLETQTNCQQQIDEQQS
ncbi:unnamed protein product [Paramecium primaurelia]|uniref:Transmembrane protein n=1 Tax=Paramecium primaurelia TaxID=5886 RepID=A0A8S1L6J1_PARPR|nr:unnamed protein product [Paramecium primaurelia]